MSMLLPFLPLLLLQLPLAALASGEAVVACTDPSDCVSLGHRYSCVVYRCTDSYSHTARCTADTDCVDHHQLCYHGLCLPRSELQPCDSQHCAGLGSGCCGGWCCPAEYHRSGGGTC